MLLEIFLTALLIMAASQIGVIFAWKGLGSWFKKNLPYLVTFAAGVFLVVSLDLIEEARSLGTNTLSLIASFVLGIIVLELSLRFIPDAHHHHHEDEHDHDHSHLESRRMLLGDAIHNIGDGILLSGAFLAGPSVGIGTAIAIFLHELVQEISEFFVLRKAGYNEKEARRLNFIVSGTILIGVFLGLVLSGIENFAPLLIAFTAGGFLYVVFRDLLPSTITSVRKNDHLWKHVVSGLCGVLLMLLVEFLFPH